MSRQLPDRNQCKRYSDRLDEAAVLGFEFMDSPDPVAVGSPLDILRLCLEADASTGWTTPHVDWTAKCVRALVGSTALHLHGLSRIVDAGPTIFVHPLGALVRSVAESCGALFWHVEPWINRTGDEGDELIPHEFVEISAIGLTRADLRGVTELHSRRRRRGAKYGQDSDEWRAANKTLADKKSELLERYGTEDTENEQSKSDDSECDKDGAEVRASTHLGKKGKWRLNGVQIPEHHELVHNAHEFGYGQDFDGKINQTIYNLLSGFSHSSIELFYDHIAEDELPTEGLLCTADELKDLISVAGRMFAATFEMATHVTGFSSPRFERWQQDFDDDVALRSA